MAGRTAWVHVVSTTLLTFYAQHAKRDREAIDAIGLLIGFAGQRVYDAWAPYLSPAGLHALGNVHWLRDLMGVHEDTGEAWAQQSHDPGAWVEGIGRSHTYRLTAVGLKVGTFFTRLYECVFRPGLAAIVAEQPWPSDLAQALNKVVEIIQAWTDEAFRVPVMSATSNQHMGRSPTPPR